MNKSRFLTRLLALLGLATTFALGSASNAAVVDAVVVMDESGSMSGLQTWSGTMIPGLDARLTAGGHGPNQFGLTGFGGAAPHLTGHTHLVGGASFGTAANYAAAVSGLVVNGGTEDGFSGIAHAMTYPFRSGAAKHLLLVTDEDRDVADGSLNKAGIQSLLQSNNTILNSIVDARFKGASSPSAMGVDSKGNAYIADGLGGYTVDTGGMAFSGFGTTIPDYVDLAVALGGSAWDLTFLTNGSANDIASFNKAFVDIFFKQVEEQEQGQVIPEPQSIAVWSVIALVGGVWCGLRRRCQGKR